MASTDIIDSKITYLHYSDHEVEFKQIDYKNNGLNLKPSGLWLSFDNQWEQWCREEGVEMTNLDNCNIYKVDIDETKMCVIESLDDLNEFCNKYLESNPLCPLLKFISWKLVVNDYDGIIFRNYRKVKKDS